jgi:hypothetical protein
MGGLHEEEALACRRLDRAGWWHRGRDYLSSRLRADFNFATDFFRPGSVRRNSCGSLAMFSAIQCASVNDTLWLGR